MDLILKVRGLIAAIKEKEWLTAVNMALSIITLIVQSMQGPLPMEMAQDVPDVAELSREELIASLETHTAENAPVRGPLGPILLPIVLALLKKLLGL